jgi:FAD:protein FMN transferase
MFRFTFEAIGTQWEIETDRPLGPRLQRTILERIDHFDITYSRFRPDSLVSRIAAAPDGGRFDFPDDSIALFDLYDRLHGATGGAVDPLVGRDLELLGYDQSYSLAPASERARGKEARARPSWSRDVIRDGASLVTRRPLVIDVGAAGKGYLVDIVSAMLHEAGFTDFVVDGSGDLRHAGQPGIRVGLEHPLDPRLGIGVANLQGGALCASAVNRRAWGDGLHHLLDARTGIPVHDVVATWVVADEAATADGLATALFFADADHLAEAFPFASVRMFADGRLEITEDFAGELFSTLPRSAEDAGTHSRAGRRRARRRISATMAWVAAALALAGCSTGTEDARSTTTSDAATQPPPASSRRSPYADGVYTATGRYGSLPSSITVRVTLANGVIRAVRVTPHATDPTSLRLQRRFAAAVPAVVIGKRIDRVRVGRLAGSSGTPDGFNAAIERIKSQARR